MIKTFRIINLIFFLLMVGINALANILPLGIGNTGTVSSKYPNLFTPAPVTFSIWGIIYLLVAAFTVIQLGLFGDRSLADNMVRLIGPWFALSCAFNIAWIFCWHYDKILLSLIFMLALLVSLIFIVSKFAPVMIDRSTNPVLSPVVYNICVAAFDVYLGWIAVATIANVSVYLVKMNWNRFGLDEQFWTVAILLVGALLGMLFILTKQRYLSAVAVVWAYCGILIKQVSQAGYAGKYPLIIGITILGIVIILSTGVIKLLSPSP